MGGVAQAVGGVFGSLAGGLAQGAGLNNNFQAGAPDILKQQDLMNQIQASQAGQQPIQQGQQQLAQALLAQSQGQGPNPAQLMMQQGMDQANKQGAGMLASARGMNPALAARMIGQNNAANNQHTVQNAGIMGAQQQLSAQGQLGSMYGQMGQQNLNQQGILQQALSNQNQAVTGGALGAQQINSGVASGNTAARGAVMGGLLGGVGALAGGALGKKSDGGIIPEGEYAGGFGDLPDANLAYAANGGKVDGKANVAGDSPHNDTVPTMLSPGEIVVPRSHAGSPELAKEFIDHLMKREGKKAKKG